MFFYTVPGAVRSLCLIARTIQKRWVGCRIFFRETFSYRLAWFSRKPLKLLLKQAAVNSSEQNLSQSKGKLTCQ